MYIFLNELSFCCQVNSKKDGRALMSEVRKVLSNLSRLSGNDPICTSRNLWKSEIAPGYTVNAYVFDVNVDQTERKLLQILASKGPYTEKILDESMTYHECRFKGLDHDLTNTSVAGACCFDGILASLKAAKHFETEHILVEYKENDSKFEEIEIPNQFDPESTDHFVKSSLQQHIDSLNDLWNVRTTLFPEIILCEEVKGSLATIPYSSMVLRNIKRHLDCMNEYMKGIRSGKITTPDYTKMGIEASQESEQTLKHFAYLRTFLCPDGIRRTFSWHSKLKGKKNIRIYFYPPTQVNENFLIGYIGKHFPVWSE